MTSPNVPALCGPPFSETQILEVYSQLERVLGSSWFRTSPRCCALLRHIVEAVIQGRGEQLRERKIGVEAFHRRPGYDSDADPVVRVAAGDVRKRLAQYYGDPESAGQVKIDLPIGSYVPVFHFPPQEDHTAALPDAELPVSLVEEQSNIAEATLSTPSEPPSNHHLQPGRSRRRVEFALVAFLLVLVIAGSTWFALRPSQKVSGFDAFWTPITSAQRRALICVGEVFGLGNLILPNSARSRIAAPLSMEPGLSKQFPKGVPFTVPNDSLAGAKVAGVLGKRNKAFDMLGESEASFNDLLNRPVILIGSYNNDWTIHFTDTMRFRFENDHAQQLSWIADRQSPTKKIGVISTASADPANYVAYAIVARTTEPTTNEHLVILAGVTSVGTLSAAEFVSDPSYLDAFAQHAPKDWNRRNIEFLISVPIVDNVPGHPRVDAYDLW
jgi:hypothetical protein